MKLLIVILQVALYHGVTIDDDLIFITEVSDTTKFVFRDCTFNGDVSFLSYQREGQATVDMGFDSIVFDNCIWTGYKKYGIRVRGSHKYVLIQNNTFISNRDSVKKHAFSITANVKPIRGKVDQRVGTVIIKNNKINQYSPRGTALFGQKLSVLNVTNNQWTIEGNLASAIKLDDVNVYSDSTEVLIAGNNFNIIDGWSAITLESTIIPKSTRNIKIYDNWFNHKIGFIKNASEGVRVMGNIFDYSNINSQGKAWYYYNNRIFSNSSWIENTFTGNRHMIELNKGVSDSVLERNQLSTGVKIYDRR